MRYILLLGQHPELLLVIQLKFVQLLGHQKTVTRVLLVRLQKGQEPYKLTPLKGPTTCKVDCYAQDLAYNLLR